MRFNFMVFVLVVGCGSAMAQQAVVRFGLDPRTQGHNMNELRLCSQAGAFGQVGADPCAVTVYNTTETESRLDATKAAVITECKQYVDTAKTALALDVNKFPSEALAAMKAQIRAELKEEIVKEVLAEIRTGRLKIQTAPVDGTKHN